jgi:hypothetical protein
MAKTVYWKNGTYTSTISVNKQGIETCLNDYFTLLFSFYLEKEFSAFLEFKNGNIKGKCESVSCRFEVQGTFVSTRTFRSVISFLSAFIYCLFYVYVCLYCVFICSLSSVKIEMEDAFGIPHMDFVGNHASDNTIFGTWSHVRQLLYILFHVFLSFFLLSFWMICIVILWFLNNFHSFSGRSARRRRVVPLQTTLERYSLVM